MALRTVCLVLTCICLATLVMGQRVKKQASKAEDWDIVFTKTEINAGPQADWDSYMRKAAQLPDSVQKQLPPGTYKVLISFVVSSEGTLQDIAVEQDPGYGLGARALALFKNYRGKWRPGIQCEGL